ncbi:inorganic diphosphatase [Hymenobacter weizhouensis]|uniref:inorganic diphosphatase n=1 Tax=Hymenobacter sp. YIM 151500-1 TaxID=2987689 RepID=UPI00222629BC|nr:inorganic diphosphatase [Hymenobacter sp. YIM 151500-1]UYZ63195.1 inorganic diphosphatase [Hymenobacter sp. YIM 151500-1]
MPHYSPALLPTAAPVRPDFGRFAWLLLLLSLAACTTKYGDLPTFSAEHKLLQVVVEVPAGTNLEQRYDPETNQFRAVERAGLQQRIEFLPFPGNLGFIPGTSLPPSIAHPGPRPLAALVLAESQPAGTVLEVLPVALLLLDVNGSLEHVVIAVPARPAQRILPEAVSLSSLTARYPGVRSSLSIWFQHWRSAGPVRIAGWKDEHYAEQQIRARMR